MDRVTYYAGDGADIVDASHSELSELYLFGGAGDDTLIGLHDKSGRAQQLHGGEGSDRLVSGLGASDNMWGEGSRSDLPAPVSLEEGSLLTETGLLNADTFVFTSWFGSDTVHDFRQSDGDRLEIDIADGIGWSDQVQWSDNGRDLVVTVDGDVSVGTITLSGLSGVTLTETDFLFT